MLKEMEKAAWNQVREALVKSTRKVCQAVAEKNVSLSKEDHAKIQAFEEKVLELTLEKMESDLGNLPRHLLSDYNAALTEFASLFIRCFRECAPKEFEAFVGGKYDPYVKEFIAMMEEGISQAERYVADVTATSRAIADAIKNKEYGRAETIIHGKLAMNPEDIGTLNALGVLACCAGKAELFVEMLNATQDHPRFKVLPELIDRYQIRTLLQGSIVENIVAAASPLTASGIFTSRRELSESQKKALGDVVEQIISATTEEVIKRIATPQRWTVENFVTMCRETLEKNCKSYEHWSLGIAFYIQWKGEQLPLWMKQRVSYM